MGRGEMARFNVGERVLVQMGHGGYTAGHVERATVRGEVKSVILVDGRKVWRRQTRWIEMLPTADLSGFMDGRSLIEFPSRKEAIAAAVPTVPWAGV
jgi:hypothetical protein